MSTRRRRRRPSRRAEEIERRLREGTYRVDLDRLADRLLDEVAPPPPAAEGDSES